MLKPTDLRLDRRYVLWYSNVARLVVTGIVPFASLTYLNSRIYTVIRSVVGNRTRLMGERMMHQTYSRGPGNGERLRGARFRPLNIF